MCCLIAKQHFFCLLLFTFKYPDQFSIFAAYEIPLAFNDMDHRSNAGFLSGKREREGFVFWCHC